MFVGLRFDSSQKIQYSTFFEELFLTKGVQHIINITTPFSHFIYHLLEKRSDKKFHVKEWYKRYRTGRIVGMT